MNKLIILAVFTIAGVLANHDCISGQQIEISPLQPHCIDSCANPLYDNCPTHIDVPWPMDQYCGIKDGVWRNYTFPCESCNDGAVGFYFGACSCEILECPGGEYCNGGNCYPILTCPDVACAEGFECKDNECVEKEVVEPQPETCEQLGCEDPLEVCEYGVCFKKFDQFCSQTQPYIVRHYCPLSRYTDADCPNTYSIQPPHQFVCAVSVTGELIEYLRECEPCKIDRHYIQYYYDQPCSTIPRPCDYNEYCHNGQCMGLHHICPYNPCPQGTTCRNGLCEDIQPYCHSNRDCGHGYVCHHYSCVPIDLCDHIACPYGQQCHHGECLPIDPCSHIQCPHGQQCQQGGCVPIDLCAHVQCPHELQCQQGECVPIDFCAYIQCPHGKQCQHGECVLIDLCAHIQCPYGQQCQHGVCIDLCAHTTCPYGQQCYYGECVAIDPCSHIQCPYGQQCQHGECVEHYNCYTNSDCPYLTECIDLQCKPLIIPGCPIIPCQQGSKCQSGVCVPEDTFGRCSTSLECEDQTVCIGSFCKKMECNFHWQCYGHECRYGQCVNPYHPYVRPHP